MTTTGREQKLLHPRLWLNEHVFCNNHILGNCGASSGGGIGGCRRGKQQNTMCILYVETTNHWLCSNVLTTKEESPTWGNHCLGVFRFAVLLSILKGFLQII